MNDCAIDPPFCLKSPYGIDLELEDPDETIRGFIDVLVLQERLWVLTVESKRTSIFEFRNRDVYVLDYEDYH